MINRLILLFLGISLVSVAPAPAQQTAKQSAAISVETASSFDPAAATEAWLNTVPPEKRAKSDAYFEGGYWLILWNFLLAVAISILLLASRTSARMRDFAERRARFKAIQVSLYAIPYFVLVSS
jgi:STE24 endopeptidase